MANNIKAKRKNGIYGYVDSRGKWVIEPIFQYAQDFSEGFGLIKIPPRRGGKYGFLKQDGSYLIEPMFDDARSFKNGRAAVKLEEKWTFVCGDGSILVEPQFDLVWDYENGQAFVRKDDKAMFLLSDGRIKAVTQFDNLLFECDIFQKRLSSPTWSFLDVSNTGGRWTFKGWSRLLDDNPRWNYRRPEEGEWIRKIRYCDTVAENILFSDWANALNITTAEHVGQLLWANAEQLYINSKLEQEVNGYEAPLRDITVLIQLYNQLKVIESNGFFRVGGKVSTLYGATQLDSTCIREKGEELCKYNMLLDDEYIDLNFMEFVELSRAPGRYEHIQDLENESEYTDN